MSAAATRRALTTLGVCQMERGRLRVIRVQGEVDLLTAPGLVEALRDDGSFDSLVLDLAEVPFMAGSAVRLVVSLCRRLSARGTGVALAAVRRDVVRVLEITGLGDGLVITEDVPAAIRLLTSTDLH